MSLIDVGYDIFYDSNATSIHFDTSAATRYDGTPIHLTATTTIRAEAFGLDSLASGDTSMTFTKNTFTVSLTSPIASQIIRLGDTVTLASNVSDALGSVSQVSYSRAANPGGSWVSLGTSTTAPNFPLSWSPAAATGTGSYLIRAVATDDLLLSRTSPNVAVTLTPLNQAPIATLIVPTNGSSFLTGSKITLTATATDGDAVGGGITKVEFYKNDTLLGTSLTPPYTYDWSAVPNGTYAIQAKAYDNNTPIQATGVSGVDTITVHSNKLPKVTLTRPAKGAAFYLPHLNDTLMATAIDSDGTIAKVEFYLNGSLFGSDATAPYLAPWNDSVAGPVSIQAKATDDAGGVGVSELITVTVDANLPPVVSAGKDTILTFPSTLILKGTASDPEGTAMTYAWTGPTGVTVTPTNTLTPTAAFSTTGVYALSLKVTDAGSPPVSTTAKINVTVASRPAITSPLVAAATTKKSFTYTITASGSPAPTLSTGALPAWLTFTASSGLLTGTPTAAGPFPISLNAANLLSTDTKTLNITVSDSAVKPTITSALTATGKTGSNLMYTITATGTAPITFAATGLPPGLILSGASIVAAPSSAGTFNVGLSASNSAGTDTRTLVFTITTDPKITADLQDSSFVGYKNAANLQVTAIGAPAVSYQWQYAAGTAAFTNLGTNSPTYSIDSVTTASAGNYRVIVKNGVGPDATSKVCVLKVSAPIVITQPPNKLTTVVEGNPATFVVRATGFGPLKYQWFKGTKALTPGNVSDSNFTINSTAIGDGGLYRVRVTNLYSDTLRPSTFAMSDTVRLTVQLPKLPPPTPSIGGTGFSFPFKVTLSDAVPGTTIYYTRTGKDPTQSDSVYNPGDSLLIDTTVTLKAMAHLSGKRNSDPSSNFYNYTKPGKVARPTITPGASNFAAEFLCTIQPNPTDADIYYTLDGSDPIVNPANHYAGPFSISQTTTVIAFAKKSGMENSDTAIKLYTQATPPAKIQAPVASPGGGDISQAQRIALASPTDSVKIYFTTNGSTPDTVNPGQLYVSPGFTLAASATVKAIATRSGFIKSDVSSFAYRLVPGPITSTPVSGIIFDSPFTVNLSVLPGTAIIHYTLDGAIADTNSLKWPSGGLLISKTTTISALAVQDGIPSPVYNFSYTKKNGLLATPNSSSSAIGSFFPDTLRISFVSTPGADIYFTRNGATPSASSEKYSGPFLIDTTTTFHAIAIMTGFEPSNIMVTTYTLTPLQPGISPIGGHFASAKHATISSTSKRVVLYYTVDNTDPGPENANSHVIANGDSILIRTDTKLKAVAVAGSAYSPIHEEDYTIFGTLDTNLRPGCVYYMVGGYTITNPDGQSAIVHIRLSSADSLNLKGFDGVQYSISLSLSDTQSYYPPPPFPALSFSRAQSDNRSLYTVDGNGKVYYLSGADTATLPKSGNYFMGIDVSPPVITYQEEFIDATDSTNVRFSISDNVTNLIFDLKRNDDSTQNRSRQKINSPAMISVKLQRKPESLKPLNLRISVSDYVNTSFCPSDPNSFLSLSQIIVGLAGPAAWGINQNPAYPYDLISLPLDLDPPLTLEDLARTQSGVTLTGMVWSDADKKYASMSPSTALVPGQSYWVASHARFSGLTLPRAKTKPHGPKQFAVQLKHGWNQIANPSLDSLYWKVSHANAEAYRNSPVKGLWGYSTRDTGYVASDFLEPWKGYFVYNNYNDTTIYLSSQPPPETGLKKTGGSAAGEILFSLGSGTRSQINLGAAASASDAVGMEDEAALPSPSDRPNIMAIRDGHALGSDWIHFRFDEVLRWKVAMGGTGESNIALTRSEIPAGYEIWAVSKLRSMKYNLSANEPIPTSGLPQDTLLIYSGPSSQLAKIGDLQDLSSVAPGLDCKIATRVHGFSLRVSLPSRASVQATLYSLGGRNLGTAKFGPLAAGTYHFDYEADFAGTRARLSPGVYFLLVQVHGAGVNAQLARKFLSNE